MSKHLFGIICTHHGTAANNRGENEGNTTTLQKILWRGDVHSTVSAEAIRWAIRLYWQERGLPTNRRWDEDQRRNSWEDAQFVGGGPGGFIDDDIMGFMAAEAASLEANPSEEAPPGGRRQRARGTTTARRGRLEVTRAVSLVPWRGDVVFSVASIGATPSAQRRGAFPVPYSTEVHATRYQYGLALTPESLADASRAADVVDAIVSLSDVAGNHSRFLFDFSPSSVIFRWTDDFAPRLLYAFAEDGRGQVRTEAVIRRVQAGDIDANELIVGGDLADSADGAVLKAAGAVVLPGVRAAAEELKKRLAGAVA
jgi:CRISPR-associated protein Cst2